MSDAAPAYLTDSNNALPDQVTGYVSVRGPRSIFDAVQRHLGAAGAQAFCALEKDIRSVQRDLEHSGFTILADSDLGLSVIAPPGAFEEITGATMRPVERLVRTNAQGHRQVTCLDLHGDGQPHEIGVARVRSPRLKIDGVVLESPKQLFASHVAPGSPKFHLGLPDDVATRLRAQPNAHGARGDGVLVAMIDSGWSRHPFFTDRNYDVLPTIKTIPNTDPTRDRVGHGTGISANLFAVAPGARLQPIRATTNDDHMNGTFAALQIAKRLKPRILSNSWGSDRPFPPAGGPGVEAEAMALEVRRAVELGILVIFASGNGHFAPEPQMPGVLAVGGVFVDAAGSMQASSFASGYQGTWFERPVVPALCGLVGMAPRAQYLMLPVPAGSRYDTEQSLPLLGEAGDGTGVNDAWALFSGTSAAAPQIAGAAAVLFGFKPTLTASQVVMAMTATARDVQAGRSHADMANEPAGPSGDKATGAGLVDVSAALEFVRLHF